MPLFRLRPEFPAAGACMIDSFRFEHFIILNIFFSSTEIKSFARLKKISCNNILHNIALYYYIIEMCLPRFCPYAGT